MNFVASIALAILGGTFAALLVAQAFAVCRRDFGRRRGVSAALAVLATACAILAQKRPGDPQIIIDALIRDAGCYATNDVFHVAVSNAPNYAAIDFSACPVLVYARQHGLTNASDYVELTPRRAFGDLPADYAIANATNYDYTIWLDYVPPSPVHTNGVFEVYGFVIENEAQGEPDQLAAGFINSRTVTLPEEE